MNDEMVWMPATEMRDAVRAKQLSPVELTEALLDRIARVNPALNAYVLVTADMALDAARAAEAAVLRGDDLGSLHGVPVSIKDLFDVEGLPTTKGSKLYRDNVATGWEYCAKRLIDAGAIHLGKTNTPEFGFLPTTENLLFGATVNPWDPTRTAGGSSGGTGSAVAAGLSPLGLGSDGGGSIRIPSSFCGVFGIKPTFGRVPRKPGGWSTMTHRGPMTRTVGDAALMLDVIAGHEPADPFSVRDYPGSFLDEVDRGVRGLRVAWSADLGYAVVDPQVRAICEAAARRFEDFGCSVEEAHPGFANPSADGTFMTLAASSDAVWLGALGDDERAKLGPAAHAFLKAGLERTAVEYVEANARRMTLWHQSRVFHERYDLLLTPAVAVTAFPVGRPPERIDEREFPPFGWSPFTVPYNLTGQPAASVPCGFDSNGLPVGLHIVGRPYEDSVVLRAARAFEEAQPWAHRRPEVAVASA